MSSTKNSFPFQQPNNNNNNKISEKKGGQTVQRPAEHQPDGWTDIWTLHGPTKRMGQMYPLNSVHRNDQQQWQEATTLRWSLQQNNNSNKDSSLLPNRAEQSRAEDKLSQQEPNGHLTTKAVPNSVPITCKIWRHLPNTTAHTHTHKLYHK